MAGHVIDADVAHRRPPFLQQEIDWRRTVICLSEEIDAHQCFALLGRDARPFQERFQPPVGEDDPLLVVRQDAPVEDVNAHRRVCIAADEIQAAEMVDVTVGNQDGVDVGQREGAAERLLQGGEAGQHVGVGPLHARAAIDQDELVAIVDDVDVIDQRWERLHRK